MNNSKLLTTIAASLLLGGHLAAQETEFDLASQRSESQDVLPVPGRRVDHREFVINPTPHKISVDPSGFFDLTRGMKVKDHRGKFAETLGFLASTKSGPRLDIDFGPEVAARYGVEPRSGAYVLKSGKKGIEIVGYDERGAFYGIQTLRQLIQSPAAEAGKLPRVEIADYPDLPVRGVVEGFYGTPWSHEVRLSLIDFYGQNKMNSYLYGPKDDPYHSCPNWRLPYPRKEARQIRELVEACNRNRVDFVWAIHPGQDIKWNEEDYGYLLNKFNLMYDLGVRSFAIFFDDISGEGTNPEMQTRLLNRLNEEFVKAKGDVNPLTVCPTDYSRLWANPSPQGSLSIYGKTLDPSIKVFWTGDVVCSDMTRETLEWVNSRIKRPAFYWWNYPVTDYARHIVMQGPVYGLDTTLSAEEVCGVVSNPMEHGEASKLALYGVADYTWNTAEYNPIDNWERGIRLLVPDAADAYRTFAIHSCDTETGYRRDESWETKTFRIGKYSQKEFDDLMAEFRKVAQVRSQMEKGCANKALLAELRPWLVEFEKIGIRGQKTLELLKVYESGNDAAFWKGYVENLMSPEEREEFEAHKSGTMKLHPFYENAMDDMAAGFFTKLTGEIPASYKGVGTYNNLRTTLNKLMFDNDSTTFYTSGAAQKEGDWIGADLGRVRDLSEVAILQGRNSVDDVDFFDHAVVEYSEDGKTWTPLTGELVNQYVINWTGEPVKARYVRLKRLESSRTNWAAIREFSINPIRPEHLGFRIEGNGRSQVLYAFDKNPATSFVNSGKLKLDIPSGTKKYTMLLKLQSENGMPRSIALRQLAADGSETSRSEVDTPFMCITVDADASRIELDGPVEIFEIITE